MEPVRVFLALGANLGDRLETLERACDELHARYGALSLSQLYETEPQGCPEGSPCFLNACVELYCSVSALELLAECQRIEKALGRERSGIYGEPRSCDIDIISYGDLRLDSPELTLPHPRAAQRSFVLQPLCDIDAQLVLAGQESSVSELLASLPDSPEESLRIFPL